MFDIIKRIWHHAIQLVGIKFHEKKYKNGLRYLLYKSHSDVLLVVFFGIWIFKH